MPRGTPVKHDNISVVNFRTYCFPLFLSNTLICATSDHGLMAFDVTEIASRQGAFVWAATRGQESPEYATYKALVSKLFYFGILRTLGIQCAHNTLTSTIINCVAVPG